MNLWTSISLANNEMLNTQTQETGIELFLAESQKYIQNTDIDIVNVFNDSLTGKIEINNVFNNFFNLFGDELKNGIQSMVIILIIIVIHSILKTIIENLGNESTAKIAYFLQYLIIVTLVVNTFVDTIEIVKNAILNIVSYMNLFIPILVTLMLASGSIVVSSTSEMVLLFAINIIGNIIESLIVPLVLISTTLSIVSNFSDKVHLSRLSKFFKSAIMWILGIVLTVFICLLSIEGTLGSSVDSMTAKTSKAAVSTFIPVVGKVMGDSVDSILGSINILKNSVGIIGVIILLGIVLIPIVKVSILWIVIKMIAAICEIIADDSIVKLFDEIADSYKVLFGILISVSAMFVIGITLILRMTSI